MDSKFVFVSIKHFLQNRDMCQTLNTYRANKASVFLPVVR